MLKKSTFREIKGSLGRYIAILAIVALGVGFFSGLKVTREAMVKTTDAYLTNSNFFDYQVMNTLGFEKVDVKALGNEPAVETAEGSVSTDILYHTDENPADKVLKLHTLPKAINKLTLEDGRMPEKANECVVDYRMFKDAIGKTIFVSENNEKDTKDMLKYKEYTITGTVVSPIYLNFERGSTSLGDGSVSGFAYLTEDGFDTDYYTEIYLRLNEKYPIYSAEYEDLLDRTKNDIQTAVDGRADRRYQDIVKDAEKELAKGQKKYDRNYAKYQREKADALNELNENYDKLCEAQNTIYANRADLEKKQQELTDAKPKAQAGLAEIEQKRQELEIQKPYMTPEQIAVAEAQLSGAEEQITGQLAQIDAGLAQIAGGFDKLSDAQAELDKNTAKYNDGKAEAERGFAKAEKEFKDARQDLREAKAEIEDIETPDTYVLDRYTNVGYSCFESDSNIVDGIAKVFPIFFFLVAALVCMTTMTRMVDEQRTQIGVLKALGYSNGAVMGKYMFYSGSASFIGCLIGFFSCSYVFPQVIWQAYGMMYDFSGNLLYIINKPLAVISLIVSLLCSMGATLVSCYAEFREVPAQLIRPKAPKSGKRILLERIPFIWKRLSFLYKVSFRNIFRYKKRFFMMVLGICGCTALLLTGLGVRDSVKNVVDYQFDEIEVYDYSVVFSKDMTEKRREAFLQKAVPYTEDVLFTHQSSADLVKGQKTKSITMIASSDFEGYDDYVNLYDRKKNPSPSRKPAKQLSAISLQKTLIWT